MPSYGGLAECETDVRHLQERVSLLESSIEELTRRIQELEEMREHEVSLSSTSENHSRAQG